MTMLSIKNLTVHVGNGRHAFNALSGVTFDVSKHDIVLVIGHSGCGKTTLVRTLQQATRLKGFKKDFVVSGEIVVGDTNFIMPNNFDRMFMRIPFANAVDDLFFKKSLTKKFCSFAALEGSIRDQDIILMDEEDHRYSPYLSNTLKANKLRGATQIVVTHRIDQTFHVADKIILMAGGRIEWGGTAESFVGGSPTSEVHEEYLRFAKIILDWNP